MLCQILVLSSRCVSQSMSVFIVSANTAFRTPYIQLSSTTSFSHAVDDNWIYSVLKVVFTLKINTNNIMSLKIVHILNNNKSSLNKTEFLSLLILTIKTTQTMWLCKMFFPFQTLNNDYATNSITCLCSPSHWKESLRTVEKPEVWRGRIWGVIAQKQTSPYILYDLII